MVFVGKPGPTFPDHALSLESFSDDVESGNRSFSYRKPHSMSSSVANSVRREAQAVIAAIINACTASTR
jgi:hypothetical protein